MGKKYCTDGCHTWGLNGEDVCRCGGSHDVPPNQYANTEPVSLNSLISIGKSVISYKGKIYKVDITPPGRNLE